MKKPTTLRIVSIVLCVILTISIMAGIIIVTATEELSDSLLDLDEKETVPLLQAAALPFSISVYRLKIPG